MTRLSLTVHCWSTLKAGRAATITGHYMDADWTRHCYVLGTRQHGSVADAKRTERMIGDICDSWQVREHSVIVDGMTPAGRLHSHIVCFGEVLKQIAEKCFHLPSVDNLVRKARLLANHLNVNSIPPVGQFVQTNEWLPQPDSPENWMSTYSMLVDVKSRYSDFLKQGTTTHREQHPEMYYVGNEEKDMEDLLTVLQTLNTSAVALLEQETPMASIVIPIMFHLRKSLEKLEENSVFTKELKDSMLETVSGNYNDANVVESLTLCTTLDPRFKSLPFMAEDERAAAYAQVVSTLEQLEIRTTVKQETAENDDTAPEPCKKRSRTLQSNPESSGKTSALSLLFQGVLKEKTKLPKSTEIRNIVLNELKEYRRTEDIALNEDPLTWWSIREAIYPKLSTLAKIYLAIPATAVPASLIYSEDGQKLLLKLRMLEDDYDEMEKIIFLHHNWNKTECGDAGLGR